MDTTLNDDSGVFARGYMRRALDFAARWQALEPRATHEPEAVRTLHDRIAMLLRECFEKLSALESNHELGRVTPETEEMLDASYVLERLEWCVLHRVPYVERRPRATAARLVRGA